MQSAPAGYIDGPSMEPNLYRGQASAVSRLGLSGLTRQAYAATHPQKAAIRDGSARGLHMYFAHP